MIVQRTWIADRKRIVIGEQFYRRVISKWRGYFLFGIIPLYITNYETTYTE